MHRLISEVFNRSFSAEYECLLIGGFEEPLYKPACSSEPALICYRLDYASSALHEAAHWCIAGPERRQLDDFGYWYEPDGRDGAQQSAFESVEVKPQALEWLFSIAAGVQFQVSADNLATGNRASEQFTEKIRSQALSYLESGIPHRAARFIDALAASTGGERPLPKHINMGEPVR